MNMKPIAWAVMSLDGYNSADFEFITYKEEEAKDCCERSKGNYYYQPVYYLPKKAKAKPIG